MNRIILIYLLALLYGGINVNNAQVLNKPGTILISTNPLKLIYGLVNIEIEYYISSSYSVQVSSEYLISSWVLKREKHPDFVVRTGIRYHSYNNKPYGDKNDPYLGVFGGYFWSKNFPERHTSYNFGAELGYKYQFNKPAFVNIKGFITYPLKNPRLIPGFECLLGSGF